MSRKDTSAERLAARIVEFCLLNRNNAIILEKFPELGLRDWWLASGCLFQTVWNLKSGRGADRDIEDYDICYFSEDTSWDAENEVIQNANALFSDLKVTVQVRNQARVHMWYPEKFGLAYPPLTTAGEGILRFPASAQTIGMKRTGEDFFGCLCTVRTRRCLGHGGASKPGLTSIRALHRENRQMALQMARNHRVSLG